MSSLCVLSVFKFVSLLTYLKNLWMDINENLCVDIYWAEEKVIDFLGKFHRLTGACALSVI